MYSTNNRKPLFAGITPAWIAARQTGEFTVYGPDPCLVKDISYTLYISTNVAVRKKTIKYLFSSFPFSLFKQAGEQARKKKSCLEHSCQISTKSFQKRIFQPIFHFILRATKQATKHANKQEKKKERYGKIHAKFYEIKFQPI